MQKRKYHLCVAYRYSFVVVCVCTHGHVCAMVCLCVCIHMGMCVPWCMYVHMGMYMPWCVCMCVYIGMFMPWCVCVESRGQPWLLILTFHLVWTRSLLPWPVCQAGCPPASSPLLLSGWSVRITDPLPCQLCVGLEAPNSSELTVEPCPGTL